MQIEVLCLEDDGSVTILKVEVAEGATVADALGSLSLGYSPADLGMYGFPLAEDQVLTAGNRIEVLRPLLIDPKMARRERAIAQAREIDRA